jgi:hypothetical protein
MIYHRDPSRQAASSSRIGVRDLDTSPVQTWCGGVAQFPQSI